MKVYAEIDNKSVANNTFRMTLYGNGTPQEARAAGIIANGIFDGRKIAQGSAYVNTKTFDVVLYDEENDKWGDE